VPKKAQAALELSLRKLLRLRPNADRSLRMLSSFEDDRTVALACATLLEQALEDAVCGRFRRDDQALCKQKLFEGEGEGNAIAGTLYAKIWLAYSLDAFGPNTKREMLSIGRIRNVFAHSPRMISFSQNDISDLCRDYLLQHYHWMKLFEGEKPEEPRQIYIAAVKRYIPLLEACWNTEDENWWWVREQLS
jgi:hypothetical protein